MRPVHAAPVGGDEKRVVFASSLGTVFEWYDFYLFGAMSAIIAKNFFSGLDESTRIIFVLLGISVWIRLQLNESPAFTKMKSEGKSSKAPLTESFGQWSNLKIVILALVGLTMGQAVVWYTGQFYALFFLERMAKVDGATANILVALSLILGTPFFVLFGWLSDKIGRKPIIMDHGRFADCGAHLFPALQGAGALRQSGA